MRLPHTMACLLLVTHAPLASALQQLASHAYAECSADVVAVDIGAEVSLADAQAAVQQALARLGEAEVLILTDVFGATPCNAAIAAADGVRSRVVSGVNVPMLWRSLCYARLPLGDLVERAVDGGRQGVTPVGVARRQNQQNRPASHASEPHPDQ